MKNLRKARIHSTRPHPDGSGGSFRIRPIRWPALQGQMRYETQGAGSGAGAMRLRDLHAG